MPPAAVVHVPVPATGIIVNELVDRLGPVDDIADQGMSQGVPERAGRVVGNGDANTSDFALVNVIGPEEKVVQAVFFHYRRCPEGLPQPGDFLAGDDILVLCPGHQVRRRERIEMKLVLEFLRVRWIYPVLTLEDGSLGICIPTVENRIAAGCSGSVGTCGEYRRHGADNCECEVFH